MYEGAFDYYLGNKPLPVFREYLTRAKKVWGELGLPIDPRFDLLDDYGPSWFQHLQAVRREQMSDILALFLELLSFGKQQGSCPPPFCIVTEGDKGMLYGNQRRWEDCVKSLIDLCRGLTSRERLETLSSVLDEILKTDPDHKLADQFFWVGQRGTRHDSRRRATKILLSGDSSPCMESRALLFWPLIGIYESHTGQQMNERLDELGVRLLIGTRERQQ